MTDSKGRKSGNRTIIVLGSLILVALIGVIIALVMVLNRGAAETEREPISEESGQRAIVIHEETAEEQLEELVNEPPVEQGYYQVSMTMDWVFPDGSSPSTNAYVRNRETNTNDVYFDIQMRDTEETIYESPVIPLGSYLDNITLDKDLDAGRYECVIVYHLIDENQNTLSTLNMGLAIIVES